jgi:hypothetical protein
VASGFRLADPQEYRRGVIFGLTLAEVMILLVFLLLLSCGALLARREEEIGHLQGRIAAFETDMAPVIGQMRKHGLAIADLDELVARLDRADRAARLQQELASAVTALDAARSESTRLFREAFDLRARIEKLSKENQAMLARLTEADALLGIMREVPGNGGTAADKLKDLLDRATKQMAASQDLTGQNAQMRAELARTKGNGGSGLPYCWTTPDGKPVYMLRVSLRDDNGVIVNELNPRPRPDDKAWPLLNAVPRGERIPVSTLLSASAPLQAAANAAGCRYAVLAVDGTGQTNKPGYKSLMGRLWSVFMVHEVSR